MIDAMKLRRAHRRGYWIDTHPRKINRCSRHLTGRFNAAQFQDEAGTSVVSPEARIGPERIEGP